ncbi:hypothetical protein [Porphyrobacter sp. AAP82]|nr:hypothetical protein [Porphyrobacter sp. AAP82]
MTGGLFRIVEAIIPLAAGGGAHEICVNFDFGLQAAECIAESL